MKILVTPTSMQPGKDSPALARLAGKYSELVYNPTGKPLSEADLIPLLEDCDGYLAGLDFITERVLEACPKLKSISRYGVGYDRVDTEAAKRLNIAVTNTPGANSRAVAELAVGLMLSVVRKIPYFDQQTKAGEWKRAVGTELYGKTLGIMGLGGIGKIVAGCCQGFGMNVLAYDVFMDSTHCQGHGITPVSFEQLLADSDVISLHLPSGKDTYHIINADTIARMKPGAVLINTSRGSLIDEEMLVAALYSGQLGGAGLDAFEAEPPQNPERFALPNLVITPHTGAHTTQAVENMGNMAVDNLVAVLEGKPCSYRIC